MPCRPPTRPHPDRGDARIVVVGLTTLLAVTLVAVGGLVAVLALRAARPQERPPVAGTAAPRDSSTATSTGTSTATGAAQLDPTVALGRLRASAAQLLTKAPRDGDAAVAAWTRVAGDLVTAGRATTPETASGALSLELAKALSTPTGRAGVAAAEAALDGKVLVLPESRDPDTPATSLPGGTDGIRDTRPAAGTGALGMPGMPGMRDAVEGRVAGAAATGSRLHVYYVNGVLNSLIEATEGAYLLETALGVHVDLVYNRSIREVDDYTVDLCMRGIVARYRDRDGIGDFGNSAFSTMFTELGRDLQAAGDAALTVACSTADEVLSTANLARQRVRDALTSGADLTLQWLADSRVVSDTVNLGLERRAKGYLRRGEPVLLIGHSQGTMFVRQAWQDLTAWWPTAYADGELLGCEPVTGEEPPEAPVGVLYISPAFWSHSARGGDINTGMRRYVALDGDLLSLVKVGWVRPTVRPDRRQAPYPAGNALNLHSLATYLMTADRPSDSRRQIVDRFGQLHDALTEATEDVACADETTDGDPTGTSSGSDPDAGIWVVWRALKPYEGIGINVTTKRDYRRPLIARNFSGGRLDPTATFTKELLIGREFGSKEEAMTTLCAGLSEVRMWPLGQGMHGTWKGTAYHLGDTVHCDR